MFYIPECGEHYDNMKNLIEENGGLVVDQHECYTIQIKPENAKLKTKDFYNGNVYVSTWITDYLKQKDVNPVEIGGHKLLQTKEDSLIVNNNNKTECK